MELDGELASKNLSSKMVTTFHHVNAFVIEVPHKNIFMFVLACAMTSNDLIILRKEVGFN